MEAGSSRIDIAPPEGVFMGGYLERSKPSEGIHDPLFARALVLDDGQRRIAIVTADLPAFEPALADEIRERTERQTGIPASCTMLALSHTHSGPLVADRRIMQPSLPYLEELRDKLVEVVQDAAGNMRPVRVGAGRAKLYLGVNRRERTDDNRVVLGRNPSGYASPYSHILVVAEENGGPIAVLFTCGAHPVVLGPENLLISGDYAGLAERVVEENFGDKAVALFALGFAGDVNANFQKRNFAEVETIGTALGRAVLEEMKAVEVSGGLALQARSIRVPIPLEPPPPLAVAEQALFSERERLSSVLGRGQDEAEINRRRMMVEWAAELVRVAAQNRSEHSAEVEIQVFVIGRIALVGLSGEVFADYAKTLSELSPFDHTFPISNANGSVGYLPTAAAFDEGGYEVEAAPRLFGALPFRPEIEGIIREAVRDLLTDMSAGDAAGSDG